MRSHGPRDEKAHESIDPHSTPVGCRERIRAGSKALELRGIVTLWSSEQKDAMSETARGQRRRKAYGSARGKRSGGTLLSVSNLRVGKIDEHAVL
jgi:hypothetical protein